MGEFVNKLLLTRLRRSLMRTKIRAITVTLLITLTAYLGVTMSEFSRNMNSVYDDFYSETNLADLMVIDEHQDGENFTALCEAHSDWKCESRLSLRGEANMTSFCSARKVKCDWIQSLWHGMTANTITSLYAVDGSMEPAAGEVVIDAHVANSHNVQIGDVMEIAAGDGIVELSVVGIAYNPLHLWYMPEGSLFPDNENFIVGYLDADTLAETAGFQSGTMNELHIDLPGTPDFDIASTSDVDEGEELNPLRDGVLSDMRENGMEGEVIDRSGMKSPEMLRIDLEGSQKSTPFVLVLLLVISGLVIAVSIDRLVKSQAREIAVLRTIGTSGKDIRNVYMLVPLALGIPGLALGILMGVSPIGTKAFTEFYFSFFDMPIVTVHHYLDLIMMIGAGSLLLIFLFGIRPAIRASRLQPLDVFGQSSEKAPGRLLTKATRSLSPGFGFALRSTFRKPGRLMVTLLALSLSMVILGGMMMMMAVFTNVFEEGLDEQVNWEAQAMIWPDNGDAAASWAQNNSSAYEMFIVDQGNKVGEDRTFSLYGLDEITTEDNKMLRVNLVDGSLPVTGSTPPQVLIDEGMSILLEWELGEVVKFENGASVIEVEITGIIQEIERMMVFNRSDLSDIVDYEANGVRMTFSEGQSVDDGLREISIMIVEKETLIKGFNTVLQQQEGAMQSMYAIGGLLAIAVLFNTLLMNLAERDTELATLRVLGASRMRLALILTVEHSFIGLIGGIAGVIASIAMMGAFASMMTTWEFYIPMAIDYIVSLEVIAFVLIASLLTTPIGIWRIGRMDLLEVVSRHER